jgi:hypothetical protein
MTIASRVIQNTANMPGKLLIIKGQKMLKNLCFLPLEIGPLLGA